MIGVQEKQDQVVTSNEYTSQGHILLFSGSS